MAFQTRQLAIGSEVANTTACCFLGEELTRGRDGKEGGFTFCICFDRLGTDKIYVGQNEESRLVGQSGASYFLGPAVAS